MNSGLWAAYAVTTVLCVLVVSVAWLVATRWASLERTILKLVTIGTRRDGGSLTVTIKADASQAEAALDALQDKARATGSLVDEALALKHLPILAAVWNDQCDSRKNPSELTITDDTLKAVHTALNDAGWMNHDTGRAGF